MSYNNWVGVPRNTSNGDYGRFHFIPNMSCNDGQQIYQQQQQQNAHFSSDGNRMIQHVHYPNCPNNRQGLNKFSDGMKEYTVEYGEDAVRAALGGNMPDFQTQFQQQYGGGDASSASVEQTSRNMTNDGKPKAALPSEKDGNTVNAQADRADDASNNIDDSDNSGKGQPRETCPPEDSSSNKPLTQQKELVTSMHAKQENITNAFESARKARSTGQVKYGRHVRPSYWKPETPNPCRRKTNDGLGPGGATDEVNENGCSTGNQDDMSAYAYPNYLYPESSSTVPNQNYHDDMTNNCRYFAPPPPVIPENASNRHTDAYQRTRSLPPKQAAVRPVYSLCGKCKKCKNLRSQTPEASVLTFPKYSNGGFQRQSQMLTSSNLGQSAKNFRAIRFSSHHL